jgi:hypothetical protein
MARAGGAQAVREALAGLQRDGEAPRIGLVGGTGSGKTVAAEAIARAYLSVSPGALIVVDNKAAGRFDRLPGAQVFESVSAFRPAPGSRVWIFKPRLWEGGEIDPREIAELQWKMVGRRVRSMVVNDELVPHAVNGGQWIGGQRSPVARAFIQGREHGLSQLWGTTALQDVPGNAADLSELWVFQSHGLAARILARRNFLIGAPPGLLEGLAGYPLPPAQRGEFVRLFSGRPWNRTIYKF